MRLISILACLLSITTAKAQIQEDSTLTDVQYYLTEGNDTTNAELLGFIPDTLIRQPEGKVSIWFDDRIDNKEIIKRKLRFISNNVKGLKLHTGADPDTDIFVIEGTLPATVLGQAQIFVNGKGVIGTVIAIIDQAKLLTWAGPRYKQAQINTVVHEIAHGLGLAHSVGTASLRQTTPLMNPSPQIDNTKIDYDLIQGLRSIYNTRKEKQLQVKCQEGYIVLQHKQNKHKEFTKSFDNGTVFISNAKLENYKQEIVCQE